MVNIVTHSVCFHVLFWPGPLNVHTLLNLEITTEVCFVCIIIGASEAKPLSSGWCENRKFGTSRLRNSFWYVAVAQYFTLYGTFAALRNSLPSLVRKKRSLTLACYSRLCDGLLLIPAQLLLRSLWLVRS